MTTRRCQITSSCLLIIKHYRHGKLLHHARARCQHLTLSKRGMLCRRKRIPTLQKRHGNALPFPPKDASNPMTRQRADPTLPVSPIAHECRPNFYVFLPTVSRSRRKMCHPLPYFASSTLLTLDAPEPINIGIESRWLRKRLSPSRTSDRSLLV
ncbi:hypothetical protein VUR80DRAFT_3454 [Thermomyces stellatus]